MSKQNLDNRQLGVKQYNSPLAPGQTHLNFESFKEEVVIQGYFEAFALQT